MLVVLTHCLREQRSVQQIDKHRLVAHGVVGSAWLLINGLLLHHLLVLLWLQTQDECEPSWCGGAGATRYENTTAAVVCVVNKLQLWCC